MLVPNRWLVSPRELEVRSDGDFSSYDRIEREM